MATPRQVETSMSKKYKGTAKVSQTTINSIKKMGMTASLKKAASSKNPEYLEGVKRMYGANRLAAAKKTTASPTGRTSPRVAERAPSATNRKSPRVAERTPSVTNRKSPRVAERAPSTAGRISPRAVEGKVDKTKPTLYKKSSKTTDPFAKFVFGVGRAAAGKK